MHTVRAVAVALLAVALVPGLVLGAGEYELTPSESVDTPDEVVEMPGGYGEFEVTDVGTYEQGAPVVLEATGVEEGNYVVLYDASESSTEDEAHHGFDNVSDGSAPVDLEVQPPGTYVVALYENSGGTKFSPEAVQPVVVNGYDLTVDAPANAGGTAEVGVDLERTNETVPETPHGIGVTAHATIDDEEHVVNTTVSDVDAGGVTAELDFSDAPAGEYTLHAAALDDEEAPLTGKPVALAIESGGTLEVTSESGSDGGSLGSTGDDGGEESESGDAGEDETADGDQSSDDSDGDDGNDAGDTDGGTDEENDGSDDAQSSADDGDSEDTDDGSENETSSGSSSDDSGEVNDEPSGTDGSDQLAPSLLVAVLGLLGAAVGLASRTRY